MLGKVYKDILSCELESENGRLSELPVGTTMVLESFPDIDDEVWPDAYIDRVEENVWILTDVTRKYMEESDIPQSVYEQMSLEMNSSEDYEIEIPNSNYRIIIRKDEDFKIISVLWDEVREDFFEYFSAVTGKNLVKKTRKRISQILPVYERAKNVIILELESFSKEVEIDQCRIIDISGRVKSVDSIEEKVYRKGILSSQIYERFDDIAGVRVVCEYISDVYYLLDYIKENPLIRVIEIDDKIEKPTQEGYRGIHVIVEVDVYYNKQLYKDVKVEIQLRTSFQNGWAMKTHELTYKRKSDLSKEISNQMKILSDSLYEADSKAQKLRNMISENSEPKDYEVYDFLLKNWNSLKFSPPIKSEIAEERKINPKRMQRKINNQLQNKGMGTKAQQALKLQHEQSKIERKVKTGI